MNGIKKTNKVVSMANMPELNKDIIERKIMWQKEIERIFWLSKPKKEGIFTNICE